MALPAYTLGMNQTATYWAPGEPDGVGGRSFLAPVTILCRWQDTAKLYRTAQGEERVSEAIVYPDRELVVGGFLALGDFTTDIDSDGQLHPDDAEGNAKEIRALGVSPDISASMQLNKVWL